MIGYVHCCGCLLLYAFVIVTRGHETYFDHEIFLTHKSDVIRLLFICLFNLQITNLEKLIEVQNTVFNTAIEDLKAKLSQESEKRQALQSELEKLAHCVTQV